jgi:protein SCO1/2
MALFASVAVMATTLHARGGDFTLDGPNGPVSLSDMRGKVVLIFFGYTACPDVCPVSLARINACFKVMDEKELERVRAFFITLDPEHDTTERLQQYTGYLHPNIIGLRDDVEGINKVTALYGIEYSKTPMPDSALGYSISHPTDILILDPQGRVVESVPHDSKSKYLLSRIREILNAQD